MNYNETFYTKATIQETFKYATSIEKRADWINSVKSAELITKGAIKLGSKFKENTDFGIVILEFVELEQDKKIRYKTIEGKNIFVDISWDLKVVENQTQVHLSFSMYPKGIFKLFLPVLFPLFIKANIKKEFNNLKEKLNQIK